MAAGLGFKDFTTGEVLTAADVDGYLMQGVWVFASAAARDAAVTSPQEGNFAYLKDTNVTTYYTGSAWANLDTTGMTNPMTTTGDTIYSSSGSTPARLGIGTAGQVLTVNSGATAPEWATPAGGGGKVLQVIQGTRTTSTTTTGTSFVTTGLTASITPSSASSKVLVIFTQSYGYFRTTSNMGMGFRIDRAGTNIWSTNTETASYVSTGNSSHVNVEMYMNCSYLDSPATTSSTAYTTHMASNASGSTVETQVSSAPSQIILMEIGA
jgi:hypothetical protein